MSRLKKIFDDLNSEELEQIYKPLSKEVSTFEVSFDLEEEETIEDDNGKAYETKKVTRAVLRGSIKRDCYIAYAKYRYKAEVTIEGKPFTVDYINAEMNSGNGSFRKKVKNSSSLKKTDEVFEYGNACHSCWMVVVAKKGNATGKVNVKLN